MNTAVQALCSTFFVDCRSLSLAMFVLCDWVIKDTIGMVGVKKSELSLTQTTMREKNTKKMHSWSW